MELLLRILWNLVGAAIVIVLLVRAVRKMREVNAQIRAFKAEQAEKQKAGIFTDPFVELAQIYAEQETEREAKRRKRARKR